jgi:hypothetical protein
VGLWSWSKKYSFSLCFKLSTYKIWQIFDIGYTFILNFKICANLEKNLNGRARMPAAHDGPWPRVRPAHTRTQPCHGRPTTTCLPTSTCTAPPVLIHVVACQWSKGPFHYFALPLHFPSCTSAPHRATAAPDDDHRASSDPKPTSEPHLIVV